MNKKVALIDYGMSNLLSIRRALEHIGAHVSVITDATTLSDFQKIVLPGVGAFPKGIEELKQRGFYETLQKLESNQQLLGICLGMQMLLKVGEEISTTSGLGLIPGTVKKLPVNRGFKVPNVNWHAIHASKASDLLVDIGENPYMYFVHSFFVDNTMPEHTLLKSQLGDFEFTAAVQHKNVMGVQFHPEKSGEKGLKLLSNFVELL